MADTNTGSGQSGMLQVRLVTPERVVLDSTAAAVELPSMSGYLEALYGAAPLLAELGAGEVKVHGGNAGEQTFFVVRAEEQHAQELWNQAGDDGDRYDAANAASRVAEEKLATATGKS